MKKLLFVNLSDGAVAESAGGGDWSPGPVTFGDEITLALRFRETVDGRGMDSFPAIGAIRAAAGPVDARPSGGTWKLQIGDGAQTEANTTTALPHDVSAAALARAINALPTVVAAYGTAASSADNGSLLVVFGDGAQQVPVQARENYLSPTSYVRANAVEAGGRWTREVRATVAPVAFTDTSEQVLPDPPEIATVQDGGSDPSKTIFWNEIQALSIPPDFRGAYILKRGYSKTRLLSREDGAEEVQEALNALFPRGFTVTNPMTDVLHIEFTGEEFAGIDQDPLEVVVAAAPEGDWTFTLDFGTAEMAALLRADTTAALELEVEAEIADDDDPEVARTVTLFHLPLDVRRDVVYPELATDAPIDWLRPPSPRDYRPFSPNQVITGSQHYAAALGDGASTEFEIAHNLGTEAVHVAVRENTPGGRLLVPGTDYSATIGGEDAVTITWLGETPPAEAGIAALITSAGPASAFAAHTHTTAEVEGLDTIIEDLGSRLETLEAILPTATPGVPSQTQPDLEFTLAEVAEIYPGRVAAATVQDAAAVDPLALPRPGGLLPAVHDAAADEYAEGALPAAAGNGGKVYENATGGAITIPGGLGRRGSTVADGGFFASDGRVLYPATKDGETRSYYPRDFERELFALFVNEYMLRVGRKFEVQFSVEARLFRNNSAAQWRIVVEVGEAAAEAGTSPAFGANLENIEWNEVASMDQQLVLTGVLTPHLFGLRITRSSTELTCDRMQYGYWTGDAEAPATANFAVRARLIGFDTENHETDPRGYVWFRFAPESGGAKITRD